MPKFGATWPTKPIVIAMFSAFASCSISSRHFTAICRVSSKPEPGRRPQPEHELSRINLGEQLGADLQSAAPR